MRLTSLSIGNRQTSVLNSQAAVQHYGGAVRFGIGAPIRQSLSVGIPRFDEISPIGRHNAGQLQVTGFPGTPTAGIGFKLVPKLAGMECAGIIAGKFPIKIIEIAPRPWQACLIVP